LIQELKYFAGLLPPLKGEAFKRKNVKNSSTKKSLGIENRYILIGIFL